MKIKTAELEGKALDWAVAKCEGKERNWGKSRLKPYKMHCGQRYSSDWAQGGPIIERHPIQVGRAPDREGFVAYSQNGVSCRGYGPTPLIAAMRCRVTSKLGDEVDVPMNIFKE